MLLNHMLICFKLTLIFKYAYLLIKFLFANNFVISVILRNNPKFSREYAFQCSLNIFGRFYA